MEPDPSLLDPGRMTVPPLFGWENIVLVLALMALVGAAFLLHSVVRGSVHERDDWQSWLEARSSRTGVPETADRESAAGPIHPSRLAPTAQPDEANTPSGAHVR